MRMFFESLDDTAGRIRRAFLFICFISMSSAVMANDKLIFFDSSRPDGLSNNSSFLPKKSWFLVTDGVMGGESVGKLTETTVKGINCLHLGGKVSLRNNGGFVQMAMGLDGAETRLGDFDGVFLETHGNNETYGVHLRTTENRLPWQSYRATFRAEPRWQTIYLPFTAFQPHRTKKLFDVSKMRRIGIVAIGREFVPDLCVSRFGFFKQ